MTNSSFSVILSVYYKENPRFLEKSLLSLLQQTRQPEKILIVKDGELSQELEEVITSFVQTNGDLFLVVGYQENKGLGEALNFGLKLIKTPYVARMDADDISVERRFEEQMNYLELHPEIDVLGSLIAEFNTDPEHITRTRAVPERHDDIVRKARLTNPMNHMTVIFKKDKVLSLGGYSTTLLYFEDYDLWVRMLLKGMKFHNLQSCLVLARVGNDMVGKRHGLQYSKYEFRYFKKMHSSNFISTFEFARAVALRIPLRWLPKSVLLKFYNFVLRKHN